MNLWHSAGRMCALLALALPAVPLQAHDSWFARAESGELSLVTGSRYPKADFELPAESIAARACAGNGAARACWAELKEFDIALDDKLVDVYMRDARPPAAVLARWASLKAGGIRWHERYRKFMRTEISPRATPPGELAALREPARMDLEIIPLPDAVLRTGEAARFRVLAKGVPVAGLAVELVSERSPLGAWSVTDAKGEVSWVIPFGGNWLVRTIAIDADGPQDWRSRFATFAFGAP